MIISWICLPVKAHFDSRCEQPQKRLQHPPTRLHQLLPPLHKVYPISWTINATLPPVKHASPQCITLRPKCITSRKNATPAMQYATLPSQNASPSPCSVAFVSKRSPSHTPETPFDTYVSIRCFVFYTLKALRRNASCFHIIAVCFAVLKKRGFDPLQQGERCLSQQGQIVWLLGFRLVVKSFEVLCSMRLFSCHDIIINSSLA